MDYLPPLPFRAKVWAELEEARQRAVAYLDEEGVPVAETNRLPRPLPLTPRKGRVLKREGWIKNVNCRGCGGPVDTITAGCQTCYNRKARRRCEARKRANRPTPSAPLPAPHLEAA